MWIERTSRLHGSEPDAARRAQHEHRLPRAQAAAVEQRDVGGPVRDRQASGGCYVGAVSQLYHGRGVSHSLVGKAAHLGKERRDRVTWPQALHLCQETAQGQCCYVTYAAQMHVVGGKTLSLPSRQPR